MAAGFPSAEQYLEAIDSDEWTEALAYYEVEHTPDANPPAKDPQKVADYLDRHVFGVGPHGNNHRKT